MNILSSIFLRNRRTNFQAGGLKPSHPRYANGYGVPIGWDYPNYIDGRPYLLPSDDQGQTSRCAAYATAGIQEAMNWWKTGKRATVDPKPLYDEAKRLDGEPGTDNGTTLEQIIKAALNLDMLVGTDVYDILSPLEYRYAMHKLPLVLLGLNITSGWNHARPDGKIPTGGDNDTPIGGHAIVGCYYDSEGIWIINSWGTDWGKAGLGFLTWKQFKDQFMGAKGFSRGGLL